jgi:heptosyltransferase-2
LAQPVNGPLVYAPNWLGDSLMARTFVARLLAAFPAGPALVAAHPRVAPLWRAWPGMSVLETGVGRWAGDAWRTARRIRKLGPFQHGYLLSASFRSAATLAAAGVPERTGFAAGGRSWLLTQPVPRLPAGSIHYGREFFNLLPPGAPWAEPPDFCWPDGATSRVRELLAGLGLLDVPYIVIAVGSAGKAKRYPIALWQQVISQLSSQLPVVLVGTASEAGLAREALRELKHAVFDLCGSTELAELAVVLTLAAGFAGVDSGAAHLAAAVGCPAVVLFGPGDPVETSPVGDRVCIVRDGLWCSPCRSRECLRPQALSECMDRISPERVASTLLALSRTRAR